MFSNKNKDLTCPHAKIEFYAGPSYWQKHWRKVLLPTIIIGIHYFKGKPYVVLSNIVHV